jgi:hypothetical protein
MAISRRCLTTCTGWLGSYPCAKSTSPNAVKPESGLGVEGRIHGHTAIEERSSDENSKGETGDK